VSRRPAISGGQRVTHKQVRRPLCALFGGKQAEYLILHDLAAIGQRHESLRFLRLIFCKLKRLTDLRPGRSCTEYKPTIYHRVQDQDDQA
jgi:hypothetical protein